MLQINSMHELAVEEEFDCDMVSNVDQEFDVEVVRNCVPLAKANRAGRASREVVKARGLCFIGQGRRGLSAEAVAFVKLLICFRAKEML